MSFTKVLGYIKIVWPFSFLLMETPKVRRTYVKERPIYTSTLKMIHQFM